MKKTSDMYSTWLHQINKHYTYTEADITHPSPHAMEHFRHKAYNHVGGKEDEKSDGKQIDIND